MASWLDSDPAFKPLSKHSCSLRFSATQQPTLASKTTEPQSVERRHALHFGFSEPAEPRLSLNPQGLEAESTRKASRDDKGRLSHSISAWPSVKPNSKWMEVQRLVGVVKLYPQSLFCAAVKWMCQLPHQSHCQRL